MPEHIAKRKIVTESSEHNNVIAVPTEAKLLTKVKLNDNPTTAPTTAIFKITASLLRGIRIWDTNTWAIPTISIKGTINCIGNTAPSYPFPAIIAIIASDNGMIANTRGMLTEKTTNM